VSCGLVGRIIRRGREERLAQSAGSLAFTTALSMVPLLAVSFALFTRIPALRAIGEGMREHLLRALLPPDITRIALKYLAQFTSNASALTLMGFVALLASAFALMMSVENALNRIWQAKKQRPLLRRLVLCAAVLLAAPMAIGASLWATSSLTASSGAMVATRTFWVPHAVVLGPVLLGAVSFSCLFRFVPHAAVPWRSAIAGGLLAGIAFEFGKRGFALYLAHVPTYRTVYRSFAPLVAFLLWVYYSWWVTLAAALVSAGLSSRGYGPAGRRPA
jgi:membrane protein